MATRAHDGHDRGTFMKAVRRGRQYIFTHSGTTEKRFMYIKKLAQPQEGGANPCLFMSSSEYAGAHTNINQERLRAHRHQSGEIFHQQAGEIFQTTRELVPDPTRVFRRVFPIGGSVETLPNPAHMEPKHVSSVTGLSKGPPGVCG